MTGKTVTVHYYAALREARGLREETLTTGAATLADLFEELKKRHGFPDSPGRLRVAVNNEFCGWDSPLNPQDKVVFIPPVSGG